MEILGKILRTISLAVLSGGSIAIVFAAIVLVHAAKEHGMTTAEAAANNAPIFIAFAKVNLGCGIILLLGEGLDFAKRQVWNKASKLQYAASLICVASTMIFAFAIVPPMERLLPVLQERPEAKEEFHKLHETSRIVFGTTILFALASLLLPIFGALPSANQPSNSKSV